MAREKLRALEDLQGIDLQIRDLTQAAEKHPQRLKAIEGERTAAKSALDALRGKLAENERSRRQNQEILGLEKEKVRKWEARLSELKTPREYAALARELEIAKKTNQTAEQELQRLAGEYEDIKKQAVDAEKLLADKESVVQREGAAIKGALDEVQGRIETLTARRTEAAKSIEPSLLRRYERVRQQRGGLAVAAVVGGTCKGCQMNIPPHMANLLRKGEEIQTCPSCQRFIYAVDAEAAPE